MLKDIFYSLGQRDAQDLRARAKDMDGTQIIREEAKIPDWDPAKDYTGWPVGAPVQDGGQVFTLLQPHNAAYYKERPAKAPSLWSICHTKDPHRAKPWVDPQGTSGMYMTNECYIDNEGVVHRCVQDNVVYSAAEYPDYWVMISPDTAK